MDRHPRIRIFEDGCFGAPAPAKGWQKAYFELKTLEKQQVQKVTLTSPPFFFLKTKKNIPMWKMSYIWRETFLPSEMGAEAKRIPYKQTWLK